LCSSKGNSFPLAGNLYLPWHSFAEKQFVGDAIKEHLRELSHNAAKRTRWPMLPDSNNPETRGVCGIVPNQPRRSLLRNEDFEYPTLVNLLEPCMVSK
jgi:hypothetical protein